VDVSIETCAHYLFFTEEDVERLGAIAKCAPPLRNATEQNALWSGLLGGVVDVVASDHSPAPPEMKTGDFWKAWGGIAGVQSTLSVLLDQGFHQRKLPPAAIASLLAGYPAQRFRIPKKGSLVRGNDADLVLVELAESFTLRAEELLQRHPLTPYVGNTFRGVVRETVRRGETIFRNGAITACDSGRLVRPQRKHDA
jgi:allantoinase